MTRSLTPVSPLAGQACARVMRRFDSYLAGELTVETNHEILEHLECCPDCRSELEARERLRAAVKHSAAATPDPAPGFETRVKALVGATPPPRSLSLAPVVLLAASVAGIAALTLLLKPGLLHLGPDTPGAVSVDDSALDLAARNHLECALKGTWPEEAPLEAVAAKLDPAMAAVFQAVAPRLAGYHPVAAHLCSHGGREFFHVIFRKDGTSGPEGLVSFAANRKSPAGSAAVALRGSRVRGVYVAGAESVDWMVFIVSRRGAKENLELARGSLPAAITAFAG